MTPTTDQLYRYANRWAAGFRGRAIDTTIPDHERGRFPTVRQCAARFGCAQSTIEDVAGEGDTTGDGYLGLATFNTRPLAPLGDWVVEAYGRTGEGWSNVLPSRRAAFRPAPGLRLPTGVAS